MPFNPKVLERRVDGCRDCGSTVVRLKDTTPLFRCTGCGDHVRNPK